MLAQSRRFGLRRRKESVSTYEDCEMGKLLTRIGFEATLYGITSSEEDDVETADSGEDDWDMILANVTAYDAPPGNAVVLPRLHLSTEKIQGWGPLVGGFEVHYDHSMPDDFDPVMVVAVGTNSSVLRESCAIDHTRVEGIPSGCGTSSRELGIGTRRKDSKEVISARGCPKCGEDIDAMELN